MKSLDLSFQASIIPSKPKHRGFIPANKNKEPLKSIAIVKQVVGKGFKVGDSIFPKMAEVIQHLKGVKNVKQKAAYTHYAKFTKKAGMGEPISLAAIAA